MLKTPRNKVFTLSLKDHKKTVMKLGNGKAMVSTYDAIEIIEKSEIIRVESCQNFMKVVMSDGTLLLSNDTLYNLSLKLGKAFKYCHKSHLVNFIHIKKLYRDGLIEMANGDTVPISRRRKKTFLEELEEWMGD